MRIEYYENGDAAKCDGYSFRRDKKTGYYLSSRKIGKARMRLHVYVWSSHNGAVPQGWYVHHVDENKSNNDISNLVLMTKNAHSKLHTQERAESNYDAIVENLQVNALPAAVKWHKSEEGRNWHKKHYAKTKEKLLQPHDYTCEECGKAFQSTQNNAKFCRNACKSKYRRRIGYDNVQSKCIVCGAQFEKNKYSRTQTCSKKCAAKVCVYKRNNIHW